MTGPRAHAFRSELFVWDAASTASWFFVTVPADVSEELRLGAGEPRGFGSIGVQATIGATTWSTSVFPSNDRPGCFVLPVKKAVRTAEGIDDGDDVDVSILAVEG